MGRQHQGMGRPGVRQVPEGSGEQGQMEKTGCENMCGKGIEGDNDDFVRLFLRGRCSRLILFDIGLTM